MLKKVLIGLGILVVVAGILLVYANYRNRTLSPAGKEVFEENNLYIEVNYSRPSVRERLIFGAEADGALQPYGSYWRLGANESTEITLKQDVLFNGVPLSAGTYKLYAVPGADSFVIGVNTEIGTWGYSEPDYTKDLFTTEVPVKHLDKPFEQLTVRIEKDAANGAIVYFSWSDVELPIQISLN